MVERDIPNFDAQTFASQGNAILGIRDSGKALALDTPIPTPSGWTTMGKIAKGDQVLDEQGQPTLVTYVSHVQIGRACFRVTFSDGAELIADEDHLWLTETINSRAAKRGSMARPSAQPRIRTTDEIRRTLRWGGRCDFNHSVSNCRPLSLPDAALPIAPYVLGCWLGDGTGVVSVITTADIEIVDEIRSEGYEVGEAHAVAASGRSAAYRVQRTPHLTYLLLSKRIGNAVRMCDPGGGNRCLPKNAALGATLVTQNEWDRDMPKLIDAGKTLGAAFTFASVEPMLEPIRMNGLQPDWVIVGGESGRNARMMQPDWAASLRDQCRSAGVPFFMKQMTGKKPIPDDLMLRQFPGGRDG